jgi:hypothetical protein
LKNALKFLKLNPNDFNTHSFRIGAATSFSVLGKFDDEIKKLGRWKSSAFSNYIRIIFKITVSPPNSNEISSILSMCLSEFWDSANSPKLKKNKKCVIRHSQFHCLFRKK